jgi:hypothetical protein
VEDDEDEDDGVIRRAKRIKETRELNQVIKKAGGEITGPAVPYSTPFSIDAVSFSISNSCTVILTFWQLRVRQNKMIRRGLKVSII